MSKKLRIGVIGAGLMGCGIAQTFAAAGHEVSVFNRSPQALKSLAERVRRGLRDLDEDEGAAARVHPCERLADAVSGADYVVEAIREDLEIKQKMFAELEGLTRPDTVLASGTSGIPITRIVSGLRHRERAVGTHWWNPAPLIPLVEVIATAWSDPAVVDWTIALHRQIGKTPVKVCKDVPGFIANRLQHALWREAVSLVENGICDAETVDTCIKASFGRRLAVLGPLENADMVGTDMTLAIHETILPAIDSTPGPSPYLRELVARGKLGWKSGEGFHSWTPEQKQGLQDRLVRHLKAARAAERKAGEAV